jgi:CheY-like chemotaxis protein
MDPLRLHVAMRKTILVVEDDAPLRHFYQHMLSAAGYAVVAVEDGVDALRRIDAGLTPSVVVLDLGLPRLNGFDVHSELMARPDTHHIPIIVVTGLDDQRGFSDHAFACVLRKPVSPEQILDSVEECLRQSVLTRLI